MLLRASFTSKSLPVTDGMHRTVAWRWMDGVTGTRYCALAYSGEVTLMIMDVDAPIKILKFNANYQIFMSNVSFELNYSHPPLNRTPAAPTSILLYLHNCWHI
jgi:hypothetical protein